MYQGPPLMPPTISEEEELRQQRRAARMQRKQQRRKARILLTTTVTSCVVLIALLGFFFLRLQAALNPTYPPINGITCDPGMLATYHIHVHLAIYIKGNPVTIPQGIGIPSSGNCYYWLHTHTSDGIVHIEAPSTSDNWLALDDFIAIVPDGNKVVEGQPVITGAGSFDMDNAVGGVRMEPVVTIATARNADTLGNGDRVALDIDGEMHVDMVGSEHAGIAGDAVDGRISRVERGLKAQEKET